MLYASLHIRNFVRTLKGLCDHLASQPLTENIYEPRKRQNFLFKQASRKVRIALPVRH